MATDTSLLMAFTAQQYHSAEAEAIASVKRVAVDILQCCPAFARWPADALAVLTVDCVLDTVGPNAVLAAQVDHVTYCFTDVFQALVCRTILQTMPLFYMLGWLM